jgi:hypothetical protein
MKYIDKDIDAQQKRIQDAARLQTTEFVKADGGLIRMPEF